MSLKEMDQSRRSSSGSPQARTRGRPASLVTLSDNGKAKATEARLPLSSSLPVTPAPEVTSLLCGLQLQSVDRIRGFRPSGTKDWLMVSSLGGQGYCRAGNGCWGLDRGDIVLIAPDTPQEYGYVDDDSDWSNIWVHFRPRPHWMPWLVWPQVSKGLMILRTGNEFSGIEAELRMMIEVSKQPTRLRQDRALNCLERVLIHCDDLNPLHSTTAMDRRIRRALELVGERLATPLGVEELSQAAGLSRSRFTVLFTEQTNMSPQAYIEYVRLSRAAQMLEMSSWPIGRIAEEVGIPNPFYFSTRFRQRFGIPPSAYRERHSPSGPTATVI